MDNQIKYQYHYVTETFFLRYRPADNRNSPPQSNPATSEACPGLRCFEATRNMGPGDRQRAQAGGRVGVFRYPLSLSDMLVDNVFGIPWLIAFF